MNSSWKPVSKLSLVIGVFAAIFFWMHALINESGFLLLDYINLPIHEFGHLFFGLFGERIGIWGGTIFQLIMPFCFLVYFLSKKEISGVTFSSFWFGENLLYIASYIADARSLSLPLVGGGEHDWNTILSSLHVIQYDTTIAGVVRSIGWVIMVSSIIWFVIMGLKYKFGNNIHKYIR